MKEKLLKASPNILQAWMFGAGIIGFGLGLLLAKYFVVYGLFVLIVGILVHGWAMIKIYGKK